MFNCVYSFCSGSHTAQQSRTICAKYGRGHYGKHSCEIILNLDQLFRRRCHLKILLFLAMAAIFFGEAEQFVQWHR